MKNINMKNVGLLACGVAIVGTSIFTFGFTTDGQTVVRILANGKPAVEAYEKFDAHVESFSLEASVPKE